MQQLVTKKINLTLVEVKYLQDATFLSTLQLDAIRDILWGSASATLCLSSEEAEGFRKMFTEQLAKVGFDESYMPTAEGKMLESLIDRFFSS